MTFWLRMSWRNIFIRTDPFTFWIQKVLIQLSGSKSSSLAGLDHVWLWGSTNQSLAFKWLKYSEMLSPDMKHKNINQTLTQFLFFKSFVNINSFMFYFLFDMLSKWNKYLNKAEFISFYSQINNTDINM